VKYMLLIYQNPAAWEYLSEEERNRAVVVAMVHGPDAALAR
jgi:predicted RNA polymerase sigma factor